jgi:hypothetical protein
MAKTTDIAITEIPSDAVMKIRSFADAQNLFVGAGFTAADLEFQASPYTMLEDKHELIGVPFLVTEFKFSESKKFKEANGAGRQFAIMYVVTQDDRMLTVVDGSTGIRDQLIAIEADRIESGHPDPRKGVAVLNGLRVSEYDYTDPATGAVSQAETFYLG